MFLIFPELIRLYILSISLLICVLLIEIFKFLLFSGINSNSLFVIFLVFSIKLKKRVLFDLCPEFVDVSVVMLFK